MKYVIKYKPFFHTYNEGIEDIIKVDNELSYSNGKKQCSVYHDANAEDYVRAKHNLGEIDKLFKEPHELHDREYGEVCATTLRILRCWIS